jgi:hypothetical protein
VATITAAAIAVLRLALDIRLPFRMNPGGGRLPAHVANDTSFRGVREQAMRKAWGAALACVALLWVAAPAHADDRATLQR